MNIGSEEMVTIHRLAQMVIEIAGKNLSIRTIPGPQGVRGRNSDNRLLYRKLGWAPALPLRKGLEKTYRWIEAQVEGARWQREAHQEGVPRPLESRGSQASLSY